MNLSNLFLSIFLLSNISAIAATPEVNGGGGTLIAYGAKEGSTPNFNRLRPEQQIAILWAVNEEYRKAHDSPYDNADILPKLAAIHGVTEQSIVARVNNAKENFIKQRAEKNGWNYIGPDNDTRHFFFSYGNGADRIPKLYKNPNSVAIPMTESEYTRLDISDSEGMDNIAFIVRGVNKNLPANPVAYNKWIIGQIEFLSNPKNIAAVVGSFEAQKATESRLKSVEPKNILPDSIWNDVAGKPLSSNQIVFNGERVAPKIVARMIAERKGCEWTEGKHTDPNPSSLCAPSAIPVVFSKDVSNAR